MYSEGCGILHFAQGCALKISVPGFQLVSIAHVGETAQGVMLVCATNMGDGIILLIHFPRRGRSHRTCRSHRTPV